MEKVDVVIEVQASRRLTTEHPYQCTDMALKQTSSNIKSTSRYLSECYDIRPMNSDLMCKERFTIDHLILTRERHSKVWIGSK